MKLIIQIPCLNEENTLPQTLADLPRTVDGFDEVEWMVIDDGSTDNTAQVASENGVDHIIRNTRNQGLARTFMIGLQACLDRGADVIVNTDADNQYNGADVPKLTAPVLAQQAEIVIGERPINDIEHFSLVKKILQKFGSWIVRKISQTDIRDAPSGFRAISRHAAQHLMVFNDYTYTLETIIQAGHKNMAITSVPIRVNGDLRPSRLFKSIPAYVFKSLITIIRIFVIYRPFLFFCSIGLLFSFGGFLLGTRFVLYFLSGNGAGHVQSLILSALLIGLGGQTILVAFITDLLAANRKLLEELRHMKQKEK